MLQGELCFFQPIRQVGLLEGLQIALPAAVIRVGLANFTQYRDGLGLQPLVYQAAEFAQQWLQALFLRAGLAQFFERLGMQQGGLAQPQVVADHRPSLGMLELHQGGQLEQIRRAVRLVDRLGKQPLVQIFRRALQTGVDQRAKLGILLGKLFEQSLVVQLTVFKDFTQLLN